MLPQTINVGPRLNEQTALQLAADLNLFDALSDIVLDFSATTHFEPFAMLLVGSAIRRLRHRLSTAGYSVTIPENGIEPEGIAAHMGFWQSCGLTIGREVGAAAGRETYLPITRIGVDELYRQSGGANPLAAGVVEQRAQDLALILAQPQNKDLFEALTYALRELIRNVLDHAMTPALWVAGMTWAKRDYVQVAVLDEGRGIRRSLADNPQFRMPNDIEAIRTSLRPGVSRNRGRQLSPEQRQRWEEEGHVLPPEIAMNAGYGLHMISSLCRSAGQFMLVSGTGSVAYIGGAEVQSATAHQGTALRLVLQPSEVPSAWNELFAENGGDSRPLLSASTLRRLGLGSLVDKSNTPGK